MSKRQRLRNHSDSSLWCEPQRRYRITAPFVASSPSMSFLASLVPLPTAARMQALLKLRAAVFNTTYNPSSLRTGSKVLKARLVGPTMLRYYGERMSGWAGLNRAVPGLDLPDLAEETRSGSLSPPCSLCPALTGPRNNVSRLIDLETRRKRGKTTPKKGKCFLSAGANATADTIHRRTRTKSRHEEAMMSLWRLHPLVCMCNPPSVHQLLITKKKLASSLVSRPRVSKERVDVHAETYHWLMVVDRVNGGIATGPPITLQQRVFDPARQDQ